MTLPYGEVRVEGSRSIKRGRNRRREKWAFLFAWSEPNEDQQYLLPSFALQCFLENWFGIENCSVISARSLSQLFTSHTTQIIFNERQECKFGENSHFWQQRAALPASMLHSDRLLLSHVFLLSVSPLCVAGSVFLFFWTGFIRKVYLTLMIQLLVTVGIICAFLYWWDTITRGHSCSKEKRRNVLYCNLLAFNCVIAHQHEAEQVHKVVPAQI